MTPDECISENPLRTGAILASIRGIVERSQPVTFESVAADLQRQELENFGELGRDEYDAAYSFIVDEHVSGMDPPSMPEPDEPPAVEAARIEAPEPPPPMSPEQMDIAREIHRLAQVALAEARAAVIGATTRRNLTRQRVADASANWQRGLPPPQTHQQALQDVMDTMRIVREQGGGQASTSPGPSAYDRERFYSRDDSARGFLKKQMFRGGKRYGRGDHMDGDGRIVRPPRKEA